MQKTEIKKSTRLYTLDYLRGFFILVIIVDHLWRWPNLFQYISGRGELWVSAAEGFVAISGLLVGYVRGKKSLQAPMATISKKLISRGLVLYLWMLITSVFLIAITWIFTFKGNVAYIPYEQGDWSAALMGILRLDYVHTLTHFLYLYAIFLVLSPLAIIALRKRAWWAVGVVSVLLWVVGWYQQIEWLQWQILFFVPVIIGFYLDNVVAFFTRISKKQRAYIYVPLIAVTLATMITSAAIILPNQPGMYIESIFTKDPAISIWRILLSFIWISGLYALFNILLPYIKKPLGWLLTTLGERSLTAYIVHIIPVMLCQLFIPQFDNIAINTLLTLGCILATWAILKIPGINKVIPR